MQLKKISTCIVCLFLLLPVTVYSQMGLYELPRGGMAVGLGFTGFDFSGNQDAIGMAGSLGYGINNRTKIVLTANMGSFNRDRYGPELDVPPSVAIGVRPVHVGSLGQTGLDYFLTGTVYRGFSSGISRRLDDPTYQRLLSVRTNGIGGGGGISKRLETNFGWVLNPFCGVSYSRSWYRISRKAPGEIKLNRVRSGYGGQVGLEIELSRMISVIGTFGISFEDFNNSFSIGLSLH